MSRSVQDCQRELYVIAQLLGYPDEAWHAGLPELAQVASELEDGDAYHAVRALLDEALVTDRIDFESRYVDAFDFGKTTSLHLTSRGRDDVSQQRASLLAYSMYFKESGFDAGEETPDYLPALVELASAVDPAEAALVLGGCRADLTLLIQALDEAGLAAYAGLARRVMTIAREIEQEVAA